MLAKQREVGNETTEIICKQHRDTMLHPKKWNERIMVRKSWDDGRAKALKRHDQTAKDNGSKNNGWTGEGGIMA